MRGHVDEGLTPTPASDMQSQDLESFAVALKEKESTSRYEVQQRHGSQGRFYIVPNQAHSSSQRKTYIFAQRCRVCVGSNCISTTCNRCFSCLMFKAFSIIKSICLPLHELDFKKSPFNARYIRISAIMPDVHDCIPVRQYWKENA